MLELMESGGMVYEELCDISVSIDRSLAGVGLTVEDIDEYCSVHCSSVDSDREYTATVGGVGSAHVNLFELLDSTSNISPCESSDLLYRHIQQQYVVPVVSSQAELSNLRQLHGHTMRRTANACGKYSPFEIVWRAEKDAGITGAK